MFGQRLTWTREQTQKLIDEFENHPLLWKKDEIHPKVVKAEAWEDIGCKMGCSAQQAKRKISKLLTAFRREKVRLKDEGRNSTIQNQNGSPKWYVYESFAKFLNQQTSEDQNKYDDDVIEISDCDYSAEDHEFRDEFLNNHVQPKPELSNETKEKCERLLIPIQPHEVGIPENFSAPPIETPSDLSNLHNDHSEGNEISKKSTKKVGRKLVKKKRQNTDEYGAYSNYIAEKLRHYSAKTRIIAEHHINNILFQADMGNFEMTNGTSPDSHYASSPFQCDFTAASSEDNKGILVKHAAENTTGDSSEDIYTV